MSVTAARGFRAAGVTAGLKPSGLPDLALVVSDGPSYAAAGVFTTNRIEAAPVTWSRQVVQDGRVAAVVLNSGGANACTGTAGFADAHATLYRIGHSRGHEVVVEVLGDDYQGVLVSDCFLADDPLNFGRRLWPPRAAKAPVAAMTPDIPVAVSQRRRVISRNSPSMLCAPNKVDVQGLTDLISKNSRPDSGLTLLFGSRRTTRCSPTGPGSFRRGATRAREAA